MKREDLKTLGLTDEQIEAVMAANGKDVEKFKAEAEATKTQLTETREKLKSFDGVDVGSLQGKVKELSDALTQKDAEWQGKVADIEFRSSLERAVVSAKAKNAKAVMALLDLDNLKTSKNQEADITSALETVKKENAYLFDADQRVTGKTAGATEAKGETKNETVNTALRAAFGKGE